MRKIILIACAASFVAGAMATYSFLRLERISSDWFKLAKLPSPVVESTEVAFKADIPLPEVKEISGTAKFLPESNSNNSYQLGYLVHVVVPPLDLKKVPEKYLKDKPTEIEGVKVVRPPIKEVYYEVRLSFALKDKDGFTIAELISSPETVTSGKDNKLQNFASKRVGNEVAARTKAIFVQLQIEKCNTCEDK